MFGCLRACLYFLTACERRVTALFESHPLDSHNPPTDDRFEFLRNETIMCVVSPPSAAWGPSSWRWAGSKRGPSTPRGGCPRAAAPWGWPPRPATRGAMATWINTAGVRNVSATGLAGPRRSANTRRSAVVAARLLILIHAYRGNNETASVVTGRLNVLTKINKKILHFYSGH